VGGGVPETLIRYLEEKKEELSGLCKRLGIKKREVLKLSYDTLAVQRTFIRRIDSSGGEKVYEYVQLKGFRKKKAYTLGTWKPDSPEVILLKDLVNLYRGIRFLDRAVEYLNFYERKR